MRYLRSLAAIRTFAWSPDCCFIVAITKRGELQVWGRDEPWPIATGEANTPSNRIAFTAEDGMILIWDNFANQTWKFDSTATRPSKLLRVGTRESFPSRVGVGWGTGEYDSNSDTFYTHSSSSILAFSHSDEALSEFPLSRAGRVLISSDYSPIRRIAATVEVPQNSGFVRTLEKPQLRIWDLSREEWRPSPIRHPGALISDEPSVTVKPIVEVEQLRLPVTRVQFDANGERVLLAGFYGGEVRGGPEWESLCRVTPPVRYHSGWTLSPDGKLVLVGTVKRDVIVYDAETGAERERLNFNVSRVSQLAFAPNGLMAAACGGTKRIAIWDVE